MDGSGSRINRKNSSRVDPFGGRSHAGADRDRGGFWCGNTQDPSCGRAELPRARQIVTHGICERKDDQFHQLHVDCRSAEDRRRINITLTEKGHRLVAQSLPLLQEQFERRFMELKDWEQHQLLSSLQRLAVMMDADEIDASPVLTSGSVRATVETVEGVIEAEDRELK